MRWDWGHTFYIQAGEDIVIKSLETLWPGGERVGHKFGQTR